MFASGFVLVGRDASRGNVPERRKGTLDPSVPPSCEFLTPTQRTYRVRPSLASGIYCINSPLDRHHVTTFVAGDAHSG